MQCPPCPRLFPAMTVMTGGNPSLSLRPAAAAAIATEEIIVIAAAAAVTQNIIPAKEGEKEANDKWASKEAGKRRNSILAFMSEGRLLLGYVYMDTVGLG